MSATLPSLNAFTPTAKDADLAKALEKVSRSVDNELADKLGDAYAGISDLKQIIQNIVRSVPVAAPPPPPPPPPPIDPDKM